MEEVARVESVASAVWGPMQYSLTLLGGASLTGPGGVVTGRATQPRRLAILAMLAMAAPKTPVRRDRILSYLWPETSTDRARHLLSVSLHALRQVLGDRAITMAGDALRLDTTIVDADVSQLAEALSRGDDEQASSLYTAPFLDGVHVAGASAEFEQWVDGERARLEAAVTAAQTRLAEAAELRKQCSTALTLWEKIAARDPLSTRAVLGAMRSHAALGDRGAALRLAGRHAKRLHSEYAAEPDAEVQRLVEVLRAPTQLARHDSGSNGARSPSAPRLRMPNDGVFLDVPVPPAVGVLDFWTTEGAEGEWLGTAIAETLRGHFQRVDAVRVFSRERIAETLREDSDVPRLIHRTGVLTAGEMSRIGRTLGADYVVGGSFERSGRQLRITPVIVDVANGQATRLTEAIGPLESVLLLFRSCCDTLRSALALPLRDAPAPSSESHNLDACESCARAMQHLFEFTHDGFVKALQCLERAIELDPEYAAPRAALAGLYAYLHEGSSSDVHLSACAASAQAALASDPLNVYAMICLAYAQWRRGNHADAEATALRAIAAAPNAHLAHTILGTIRLTRGIECNRFDQCVAAVRPLAQAAMLDPRELISLINLPWLYMYHGQYELARPMLDYAVGLEMEGGSKLRHGGGLILRAMLHRREREWDAAQRLLRGATDHYAKSAHLTAPFWLTLAWWARGDIAVQTSHLDEAAVGYRRAIDVSDGHATNLSIGLLRVRARIGLAIVFEQLLMRQEAEQQVRQAILLASDPTAVDHLARWEVSDALMHFDLARYHAVSGNRDAMASALDRAVALGWSDAPWLDADVCFDRFQRDPAIEAARAAIATRGALPDYRRLLSGSAPWMD